MATGDMAAAGTDAGARTRPGNTGADHEQHEDRADIEPARTSNANRGVERGVTGDRPTPRQTWPPLTWIV